MFKSYYYPSVHFLRLIWGWVTPEQSGLLQLILRNTAVYQASRESNLSGVSWVYPQASSRQDTSSRRWPPQQAHLVPRTNSSSLSLSQMNELLSLSVMERPATLKIKRISTAYICNVIMSRLKHLIIICLTKRSRLDEQPYGVFLQQCQGCSAIIFRTQKFTDNEHQNVYRINDTERAMINRLVN